MRVLTWNMNGIRSVVSKFGNMMSLLEALSAGVQTQLLSMLEYIMY
jgi:exonuclease III